MTLKRPKVCRSERKIPKDIGTCKVDPSSGGIPIDVPIRVDTQAFNPDLVVGSPVTTQVEIPGTETFVSIEPTNNIDFTGEITVGCLSEGEFPGVIQFVFMNGSRCEVAVTYSCPEQ